LVIMGHYGRIHFVLEIKTKCYHPTLIESCYRVNPPGERSGFE